MQPTNNVYSKIERLKTHYFSYIDIQEFRNPTVLHWRLILPHLKSTKNQIAIEDQDKPGKTETPGQPEGQVQGNTLFMYAVKPRNAAHRKRYCRETFSYLTIE